MRWYLVFAGAWLALLLQEQSLMAQMVPLPQNNSVKLRLEIEMRGVLSVTEKSATITNKETIFEWVKNLDPKPGTADLFLRSHEVDKVWVLELDDNLKKTARTLHGQEIVVTGKCLLLGIKSQADTGKTPASIGSRSLRNPRGGSSTEVPVVVPEGFATSVQSQFLLDDHVTVLSLKATK
jgi:hypothetical protein